MKARFVIFLAVAQGIWPGGSASASTNAPGDKLGTNELVVVRSAATNSLIAFQRHITESTYRLMGFSSVSDALAATTGEPLQSFTVPFTQLTNYQGGSFAPLLEPPPQAQLKFRVFVPIMSGTNVRSAIKLRPEEGQPATTTAVSATRWVEDDWGHPNVIRNLIGTHDSIPANEIKPDTVAFAVEVLTPRIWLIGYYDRSTPSRLLFRATTDLHLGAIIINRNQLITQPAMLHMANVARRYNPILTN